MPLRLDWGGGISRGIVKRVRRVARPLPTFQPSNVLTRSPTSMQALLGPDAPSMDAVQRTLLHHFSEVFDVELEPEIGSEIGSVPPADATAQSGATGPTPDPLVRPTELAEPVPPAGFAWGGTS